MTNKVENTPQVTKKTGGIVEAFEELKNQKVPEGASSSMGSVAATMMEVFEAYPTTVFTQAQFVEKLKISNPFCNHQLHNLMAKGAITRVGSARKYYYSLAK
jgi:hypothetical protein